MRTAVVTAAAAALLLALAGCSDGGDDPDDETLDRETLEQEVKDALTELAGQAPDDISCPDPLVSEVDATTRCTLTAGGDEVGVTVTVTSVDGGETRFDIEVDDEVSPSS